MEVKDFQASVVRTLTCLALTVCFCSTAVAQSGRCASPSSADFAKAPSAIESIRQFASNVRSRAEPLMGKAEERRRQAGQDLVALVEKREAERIAAAEKAEEERKAAELERQARWEAERPAREARRRERERERRREEREERERDREFARQAAEQQRQNTEMLIQGLSNAVSAYSNALSGSYGGSGSGGVDNCFKENKEFVYVEPGETLDNSYNSFIIRCE